MFALAMEEDRTSVVEEIRACRARLTEVLAELRALEAALSEAPQPQPSPSPSPSSSPSPSVDETTPPVRLHSVR
jgi:hypothetical protein